MRLFAADRVGDLSPFLKALARSALFPAAEAVWSLAFRGTGMVARAAGKLDCTYSWPTGRDRVLVIAPHPDDETLGCGGTIVRHLDAGDRVRVMVVTDGSRSRARGLPEGEMRKLRAEEMARAVSMLGDVDLLPLSLREGCWSPEQLRQPLLDILASYQPTMVYTASCLDFHPEHIKVADVVAEVLGSLAVDVLPRVRVCELQVPLTPVLANVVVDIESALGRKYRALAEYKTQHGSLYWTRRQARYLRSLYGCGHSVESFWELNARQFSTLMRRCGDLHGSLRSIRQRPFSDGLAWTVGLSLRVRAKRIASYRQRELDGGARILSIGR